MHEQQHRLKKFNHQQLPEIIQALELPDAVSVLIADAKTDIEIIDSLINAGYDEFATKLLAMGLPHREVIWWAYLCCQESEKNNKDQVTQEALQVIDSWVKQPTDFQRRIAGKLAEQLEYYSPSSWIAAAVFWSGGSITPEEKPQVEPAMYMCNTAASNAILFSAEISDDSSSFMKQALRRGLHIAMGGNGKIE